MHTPPSLEQRSQLAQSQQPPARQAEITELVRWDREHAWHPFTPMEQWASETPLIIERGEGPFLFDVHGNRYIDGVSSLWCNVHGHRVPELDAAIREQLDKIAHSTMLGLANVPATRLARKLVELAPPGLNRVFYSDNGSTAVEVALKMAFQYWRQAVVPQPGKTKFLAPSLAYHGDTLGSTSVGGVDRFHSIFGPLLFQALRAPAPASYRWPAGFTRESYQEHCMAALEQLVATHHEELAAVVIEPLVQGAAGIIVAPDGYLRRVREVTKRYNVLLIADEVAVGFGRTGTMFACEQENVTPDFLCVAKGLTAGYLPLAATLATEQVYEAFLGKPEEGRTFFHGHTFTGNPLGAAVALANLELFEKHRILENLPAKIERLSYWLARCAELPTVGDVRQKGMMAGLELVESRADKKPFPVEREIGRAVCKHARSLGAVLRPLGDVVVLMPPLAIPLETLDELGEVVYRSIAEVCG